MKRPVVLIIDDEEDIRILYKTILRKKFDFEIVETDSLMCTRNRLENIIPDYVLLDLCLPDGDGYDIVPMLKKINPKVKILVISAFNCGKEIAKVSQCGAIGLLAKPFEKETFIQHIEMMHNQE